MNLNVNPGEVLTPTHRIRDELQLHKLMPPLHKQGNEYARKNGLTFC